MASATAYWTRKLGSKYHATKTEVDGWTFDSKKEAARYSELVLLGLAGELHDLELQPQFPLIVNGFKIGTYRADFAYVTKDGERVIEDVKGMRMPVYKIKRKLVAALYGVQVQET